MLAGVRYVLLVLAIPAALAAYLVTGTVLANLGLAGALGGLVVIFLPLLAAGLVSIPLIAPFIDAKAKQALADAPGARARAAADAAAKPRSKTRADATPDATHDEGADPPPRR
jgi:predicted lipid-binding transport protein (Tim44 family)